MSNMAMSWTSTDQHGAAATAPLTEIVHDLRQPLATMRALIASLQATEFSPDAMRWHLDKLEEQADHMSECVRGLLADLVASPGADAVGDDIGCRYEEVSRSVAATVQSFAVTWSGRITTTCSQQAVVPVPKELMRRAVRNLLDNAARAAGQSGAIIVSVTSGPRGTRIAIEDNGPGFGAMPAQHSVGLQVVERALSAADGFLEITTSAALGGAVVTMCFPPHH